MLFSLRLMQLKHIRATSHKMILVFRVRILINQSTHLAGNNNNNISACFFYLMCTFGSSPFKTVSVRVFTRRERSKVPLIVRQCVEEIERRGMEEVGIYRVSGVATDIQALKAAFDSSEFHLDETSRQNLPKKKKKSSLYSLVFY